MTISNSPDDFERILSCDLLASAALTPSGTELLFPYSKAEKAVREAQAHQIAVLGVEVFRVLESGLGVEDYSGYGFDDIRHDWLAYAERNNKAALAFIATHIYGEGYGYILTAASRSELEAPRAPENR